MSADEKNKGPEGLGIHVSSADPAGKPAGGEDERGFSDADFEDLADDIAFDDDGADDPAEETPRLAAKKMKTGGGGLSRAMAPVLILAVAAGIGGYIVMNPQMVASLAGGGKAPADESGGVLRITSADEGSAGSPAQQKAAPPESVAAALPQPAAGLNEIPRGPEDEGDAADPGGLFPGGADDMANDITEGVNAGAAPVPAPVADISASPAAPSSGELLPGKVPSAFEDEKAMPGGPEKKDTASILPEKAAISNESGERNPFVVEEKAKNPFLEDIKPAAEPVEPARMADAGLALSSPSSGTGAPEPAAAPPVQEVNEPAPPMKKAESPKPAKKSDAVSEDKAGSAATAGKTEQAAGAAAADRKTDAPQKAADAGGDAYYDATMNVPTSAMSKSELREVSPVVEPASRFVVVSKQHKAGDVESTLVAANRALKLGRYDSALEMFDALYAKNARDQRILMGRAVAQQNAGMPESAIQTYEELLKINPKSVDALSNMLGIIRTKYPDEARRRLLDLLAKHPGNAGIAAQIGLVEAESGNAVDALKYLGMAASIEPHNAQHVYNMAVIADRKGDAKQAVAYYEKALEVDAVYGNGQDIQRQAVYDRLAKLRQRL